MPKNVRLYTGPFRALYAYSEQSWSLLFVTGHFHYGDVIMSEMVPQIISVSIAFSPFVQAQSKENIKAPRR